MLRSSVLFVWCETRARVFKAICRNLVAITPSHMSGLWTLLRHSNPIHLAFLRRPPLIKHFIITHKIWAEEPWWAVAFVCCPRKRPGFPLEDDFMSLCGKLKQRWGGLCGALSVFIFSLSLCCYFWFGFKIGEYVSPCLCLRGHIGWLSTAILRMVEKKKRKKHC